MKEVVWVYGVSAAGKETFIQKVVEEQPEDLLERLGWLCKNIIASQASLKYIGHTDNDEVVEKRQEIEEEVPRLAEDNDVVLVKGQFVDYVAKRQAKLKKLLPSLQHKIIVLEVHPDHMPERLRQKAWWTDKEDPMDWTRGEKPLVDDLLEDLGRDFEIIRLDSSTSSYDRIP